MNFLRTGKWIKGIPIYKKGDKLDPGNYRPVAIHSVFRKIFCKIIYDRVEKITEIHPNQFGFIKGKRCSDHASFINDMIYTYNKNKSLGKLYIGSFDFEGAFDSCDFEILIEHVKSQGVGGKLLNVISAIYTNPQSKIYINGTLSEQYPIKRGVAKGCKLSTILFNIYINS